MKDTSPTTGLDTKQESPVDTLEPHVRLAVERVFTILAIPESSQSDILMLLERRAVLRSQYAALLDALVEFGKMHAQVADRTISTLLKREPSLSAVEWVTVLSMLGTANVNVKPVDFKTQQ